MNSEFLACMFNSITKEKKGGKEEKEEKSKQKDMLKNEG